MKHKVSRPSSYLAIEKVTCDLCKREMKENEYDSSEVGKFNVATLVHKSGSNLSHGDGGESEEVELDFCTECWKHGVFPALKKLGVEFNYKKVDW